MAEEVGEISEGLKDDDWAQMLKDDGHIAPSEEEIAFDAAAAEQAAADKVIADAAAEGKSEEEIATAQAEAKIKSDKEAAEAAAKEITDKDYVKSVLGDKYSGEEGLKRFKSEYDEIQGKLNASPSDGIKNPRFRQLNTFAEKTGIEDVSLFDKVTSSDLDSIDPIEAIVIKKMLDNPKYVGRYDLIKKSVENNYKTNSEDHSEDEIELDKLNLEGDAETAIKAIKEIRESIKVDVPTNEEVEKERIQQVNDLQDEWKPYFDSAKTGFETLKLFGVGEKGEKPKELFDFKIEESEAAACVNEAAKFLIGQGEKPTEENREKMVNFMRNYYLIENQAKVMDSFATHIRNLSQEEFEKKYDNPGAIDRKGDGEKGAPEKSMSDQVFDEQMKE